MSGAFWMLAIIFINSIFIAKTNLNLNATNNSTKVAEFSSSTFRNETKINVNSTNKATKDDSGNEDESTGRLFSWSNLSSMWNNFLVFQKNFLVAYPFAIASTIIDIVCSSTILMHNVPQRITPNIRMMNFQFITACKNFSVPLQRSEQLWRHSSFNAKKKVVILATGWTNTINDSSTLAMFTRAFLCRNDANFIIVDTASYVDTLYKWAALNTEEIGESIAVGLMHLIKLVPLQNIHLIGHSLGAHIMGTAGRKFTNLTGKKIPRITGLDPAKPCFRKTENLMGLQRNDAALVDVIHTNIGILAKREPMGHIDFYPGGANSLPPGCLTIGCAHTRAVEYFVESVYPGNERNFLGLKCDNWSNLQRGNCYMGVSYMGYIINKRESGIFNVDVNRDSPFGKFARRRRKNANNRQCHVC